jgi:hypothetical protein
VSTPDSLEHQQQRQLQVLLRLLRLLLSFLVTRFQVLHQAV